MLLNYNFCHLLLGLICLNSSLLVRSWDVEFNRNFICKLETEIHFQEMIWFVSKQMNTTNSDGIQDLIIKVNECLGTTQSVLNSHSDKPFLKTTNKKHALSVVFTTSPDDPILEVHDVSLRGRHFFFGLLIMVNTVADFKVVEQFLIGLSKVNLQNTLLYYYSTNRTNQLFGNTMYPELRFENRTNYFEYLKNTLIKAVAAGTDMEGYKLYTPLRQDVPHVFSYVNASGHTVWQGSAFNLLKVFMDYCNGTLVSYEMPKDRLGGDVIDMKAALELIRKRKVAVMAHAYALFQADEDLSKSYPIKVVRWCLMVPIWNSVTTMYYLTESFDKYTWFGILCVFNLLLVAKCLQIYWHNRHQLARSLSDIVLYCFCLSIGITTPQVFRAPPAVYIFICATVFFYGFFLVANYTSVLGSIFTVTLFRAQFKTMDDIIRNNLSVMIIDYELDFLRSTGNELPANFSRLIQSVDAATFNNHQLQLNSSFAYFVTEDKWHFLNLQQKYLKQGIFKFTDICFGSYHLAYPLQPDALLYRNIEYYIYRMYSSGMLEHYEKASFDYAVKAGLLNRLSVNTDNIMADMDHLFIVFFILLGMSCVSILVFVVELLIYKITN